MFFAYSNLECCRRLNNNGNKFLIMNTHKKGLVKCQLTPFHQATQSLFLWTTAVVILFVIAADIFFYHELLSPYIITLLMTGAVAAALGAVAARLKGPSVTNAALNFFPAIALLEPFHIEC